MAQLDTLHWKAEQGQNWTQLAAVIGCTRNALLTCNGLPTNSPPALSAGRIVHVPFSAVI